MEERISSKEDLERVHLSLVSFDEDSASERIASSIQETQATDLLQSSHQGEEKEKSTTVLSQRISSREAEFQKSHVQVASV